MIELEPYDLKQYKHFTEDLMTIIDFCNEAAGVGSVEAIRDAHDIAHVLLGGDKTREWLFISNWLNLAAPRNCTQAWPDVQDRMSVLFERLGGKVYNEKLEG